MEPILPNFMCRVSIPSSKQMSLVRAAIACGCANCPTSSPLRANTMTLKVPQALSYCSYGVPSRTSRARAVLLVVVHRLHPFFVTLLVFVQFCCERPENAPIPSQLSLIPRESNPCLRELTPNPPQGSNSSSSKSKLLQEARVPALGAASPTLGRAFATVVGLGDSGLVA